jgi:hypothetical protein
MTIGSIPYTEIQAWARLNRIRIGPSEVAVIVHLDNEYLRAHAGEEADPEPQNVGKALGRIKAEHDMSKKGKAN